SAWSRARSARGSEATTRAATPSPLANSTITSSAICTTWAAVNTLPSADMRTPEPTSLYFTSTEVPPWARRSLPLARTTTTDPVTRWKTCGTLCASPEDGAQARAQLANSRSASGSVRPAVLAASPFKGHVRNVLVFIRSHPQVVLLHQLVLPQLDGAL